MKSLLTLVVLSLSLTLYSQVPSHIPTSGLMAYWPFDGNADDLSGFARDGAAFNVTPTDDQDMNPNAAYNFDYTGYDGNTMDDFVVVYSDNWMNTSELTVSIWFKPTAWSYTGNSGTSNITNRYWRQTNFGPPPTILELWSIVLEDDGTLKARMNDRATVVSTSAGTIELNNWYHAVFTYDDQELKFYLNGALVGSENGQDLLNLWSEENICFGMDENTSNTYVNPFNGVLDNAGMWNRALTACEVQEIYTKENCTLNIPSSTLEDSKIVVKIVDLLGRETEFKPNIPLIYIYSDGSTERMVKMGN